MSAMTTHLRDAIEIGLAVALTLAAIVAGYAAGRTSADGVLARPASMLVGEAASIGQPGEVAAERLVLLLLGQGSLR